jgi:hypothetical protein
MGGGVIVFSLVNWNIPENIRNNHRK